MVSPLFTVNKILKGWISSLQYLKCGVIHKGNNYAEFPKYLQELRTVSPELRAYRIRA
ncbi:conserved hypothetical protein [delta proteobacterium NaphS2]|nr:conserved hypothetical protein [delta proteobacterium NaphS2]